METGNYLELFYNYAKKNQIEIIEVFSVLEKDTENKELVDSLFINLHVLNGNASGLGFKAVESMAHVLEDVFSEIREGKLEFNNIVLKETKIAIDTLGKLIEALKSGEKVTYLVSKTRLGAILGQVKQNN